MRPSRRQLIACSVVAITPLAGCSDDSNSEPSDEQSNIILEYEIGRDHHTNGLDWFNEAFDSYNSGQFDEAKADFDSAGEEFDLAAEAFRNVSDGLVEHGTDEALEVNTEASTTTASAGSEARSCSSAAATLPGSNEAEQIIERVQNDHQENQFSIPSKGEFENSLSS